MSNRLSIIEIVVLCNDMWLDVLTRVCFQIIPSLYVYPQGAGTWWINSRVCFQINPSLYVQSPEYFWNCCIYKKLANCSHYHLFDMKIFVLIFYVVRSTTLPPEASIPTNIFKIWESPGLQSVINKVSCTFLIRIAAF